MGLLILLIVLFACRRRYYDGPYWNHPYYRSNGPYYTGAPGYAADYRWHPYYGYSRCYGRRPYGW